MNTVAVPSREEQLQEELQSALLADDPTSTRKLVEVRGKQVEVRAPTVAQEKTWESLAKAKDGKVDPYKVTVLRIIGCTFVPGSDRPVFTRHHEESLLKSSAAAGGTVAQLGKAIQELLVPDAEDVRKNSSGTPAE